MGPMVATSEVRPSRIGDYEVLGILGRGGMGVVYHGRDSRLERNVAIKALPAGLAADPMQRARFDREAKLLATFNHPNIAGIHGLEDVGDVRYLILEHVDGQTLADRLKAGPLPIEETLKIAFQVTRALETAHDAGIIHRDLKPGNIMITRRLYVKVLDFGLARHSDGDTEQDPHLTAPGHTAGTPGYMSPEQLRAKPQGPETDIFAFGSVLYECLTGRRAFPGTASEAIAATLLKQPEYGHLPADAPAELVRLLRSCLDKDPRHRPSTESVHAAIALLLDPRHGSGARATPAQALPRNLPRLLTNFVGRKKEVDACSGLIREARLVTLTGSGGAGKTRLALRLLEASPEGIEKACFADLSHVLEPASAVPAIAVSIDSGDDSRRAGEADLLKMIGARALFLCLDNCEHLLPDLSDLVQRMLQDCPAVRILATSREALGIPGERVFAVPALEVPGADAGRHAESAARFEAVRLFVDRAGLVCQAFEWNDGAAPVVTEICRKLDGIPLAIELAAARVKVLSVAQIHERLADRFRLLTGGAGGDLARHQTLRATIQWSYDHLADQEKQLFRSLAVFSGGCTLDAATAVSGEDRDEYEVLDLMSRLVDKSLVVVLHARGELPRYRCLETIREYAGEMLEESGEGPAARERHLLFFAELVEQSRETLTKPDKSQWLGRLDAEHQNLLAALSYCDTARNGAELSLRMATSLWRFWEVRGHYAVGHETLLKALARPGGEPRSPNRALALYWAGFLIGRQGRAQEAQKLIEQSLALWREIGDIRGEGRALNGLGTIYTRLGDFDAARRYRSEYLALCRDLGEKPLIATALNNLGDLEMQARNFDAARPVLEESLVLGREIGDQLDLSMPLQNVGYVALKQNDLDRARETIEESLRLIGRLGARYLGGFALEYSAYLASALGRHSLAARLLGASNIVWEGIGYVLTSGEREEHDLQVAKLKSALGDEAFAAAWAGGRNLSFDEAFEEASAWYSGGCA